MNSSRIFTIKNAKFSGYYFYMNLNTWGDCQKIKMTDQIDCSIWSVILIFWEWLAHSNYRFWYCRAKTLSQEVPHQSWVVSCSSRTAYFGLSITQNNRRVEKDKIWYFSNIIFPNYIWKFTRKNTFKGAKSSMIHKRILWQLLKL